MPIADLLNRPLTIIRRTDSGDTDEFGNEIPDETMVDDLGALQQMQRKEPTDAGELSAATYTLFLAAGTVIDTGDAVIVGDSTYELVGDPSRVYNERTGIEHHVKATVVLTAGQVVGS